MASQDPVEANFQCWRHLTQQYLFPCIHILYHSYGHTLSTFESALCILYKFIDILRILSKMPLATRYPCSQCRREFVKEFLIKENGEYTICLFCEVYGKSSELIEKKLEEKYSGVLERLQRKVLELETRVSQNNVSSRGVAVEKDVEESSKVGRLEDRIGRIENRLQGMNSFQPVRRGARSQAAPSYSSVVMRNRFQVLEDEVRDDPSIILVGDSLVRHQDKEFCRRGARRKNMCYPGGRIQDITEKIDDLVVNSSEETVFVHLVGTNNVVSGRSEETFRRYRNLVEKLRDSRRRSVVCGLLPRYDVGSLILSRMLGLNTRVQDLCRKEGVMFVDLWDDFCTDRNFYGKDGLHLNRIGKARLGRALDEGVRRELKKNRTQVQGEETPSGLAGRGQSSEAAAGRASQAGLIDRQVGNNEIANRIEGDERLGGTATDISVDQQREGTSTEDLNV